MTQTATVTGDRHRDRARRRRPAQDLQRGHRTRQHGDRRRHLHRRQGRVRLHRRPQRRGQDDAAALHLRARRAQRRDRPVRGPTLTEVPDQLGVVFQDYSRSLFPWFTNGKQRRPAAEGPRASQGGARRSGSPRCCTTSAWARREEVPVAAVRRHAAAGRDRPRARPTEPDLLLMDEPFASVDAQTRFDLEDLILRCARARHHRRPGHPRHRRGDLPRRPDRGAVEEPERRASEVVDVRLGADRSQVETRSSEDSSTRRWRWRSSSACSKAWTRPSAPCCSACWTGSTNWNGRRRRPRHTRRTPAGRADANDNGDPKAAVVVTGINRSAGLTGGRRQAAPVVFTAAVPAGCRCRQRPVHRSPSAPRAAGSASRSVSRCISP